MPPAANNDVSINEVIYDFLTIEIVNTHLHHKNLSYAIIDTEQRIIRKGNFNGLTVHLRVAHMMEGKYFLRVSYEDKTISLPFKKITSSFSELSYARR